MTPPAKISRLMACAFLLTLLLTLSSGPLQAQKNAPASVQVGGFLPPFAPRVFCESEERVLALIRARGSAQSHFRVGEYCNFVPNTEYLRANRDAALVQGCHFLDANFFDASSAYSQILDIKDPALADPMRNSGFVAVKFGTLPERGCPRRWRNLYAEVPALCQVRERNAGGGAVTSEGIVLSVLMVLAAPFVWLGGLFATEERTAAAAECPFERLPFHTYSDEEAHTPETP